MNRILPLLITLFIFNACQTDESEEQDGTGKLSIELGITIDENPIGGRTEDFVPLENFVVIIQREDGTIFQQFERAADVPAEIELPTGNYKVIAHSNNENPAEFENPYYYGESEMFSIDKEEFKVINVVCELANMKVTVTYSDNVVTSFDSYATTVVNNTTADFLVFNETETREGYFSVDPLSISATLTFTKTDGSVVTKEFTGSVTNPQPKTHYDIQVDAVIQDGQIAINIQLDESLNSEIISLAEQCSCPSGQTCFDASDFGVGTICVEPCENNAECPDGLNCLVTAEGSLCYKTCTADSECPEGYYCDGICVPISNLPDTDYDSDGISSQEGDCNDNDGSIYPGAVEICTDGLDNDCDGLIDSQDPDALGCDIDNDSDGFSVSQGDCNDEDSEIYPGAAEIIDGIDNDCDGMVDEAGGGQEGDVCSNNTDCLNNLECYNGTCQAIDNIADLDGDGFNIVDGDCDDNDDSVYPGAPELADGKDNNCDGQIDVAFCGNGVTESDFGEECDGGANCNSDCTLN